MEGSVGGRYALSFPEFDVVVKASSHANKAVVAQEDHQ